MLVPGVSRVITSVLDADAFVDALATAWTSELTEEMRCSRTGLTQTRSLDNSASSNAKASADICMLSMSGGYSITMTACGVIYCAHCDVLVVPLYLSSSDSFFSMPGASIDAGMISPS
ncbi:hypothetical protein M404DRAFT_416831 [Pisolithus tinctorius Marx 270]|uniref:Uncharacterized protein n=1 Tax=Pisolithus tinctorius Marx 270 TaxID=870435 RepID=A0A0C3PG19_PISTI|nr:hypothetical protein M404DRAFT_416831 [Pisolithus tinctorius Marx 270]